MNPDIPHSRLHSQLLIHQKPGSISQVIQRLGAIQGQDYLGALWSLGLRLPGSTQADLEKAFTTGELARFWGPRGTLFICGAADLRWLNAFCAARTIAGNQGRYKQLGLDDKSLTKSVSVIAKNLGNLPNLTRRELKAALEGAGIDTSGQRLVYLLQRAGLEGVIYQAAVTRNEPIYALMDEHIPANAFPDRDQALTELARRYFTSRGLARLTDFAWWAGIPKGEARQVLDDPELKWIVKEVDGVPYYATLATQPSQETGQVHLLPGFDEYLLAYEHRDDVLDPAHRSIWWPGGGMFKYFILADGRFAGTWKRELKTDQVIVTLDPLKKSLDRDALRARAEAYAAFLELPLEIR
jgi:hypothetical protein